jgi:large subunit ribosomal protein L28
MTSSATLIRTSRGRDALWRRSVQERSGIDITLEYTVASVCDVCGKRPGFGKRVSHSHVRTSRRWNPNIQRVRAVVGRTTKRLNVCTSCIKAGKIIKPAR